MNTGIASITFRQLTAEQIIALCRENALQSIEWGGDVHVPHGDIAVAEKVGEVGLDSDAAGRGHEGGGAAACGEAV